MKKAMRYAAAATACVLLTGCASENSTGLVRFFKEDYFEQTTTTQTTTAPETSATTQTTAEPLEIEPMDIPTIDIDDSGDTVTIYSFTGDINTFLDGWEPLGAGVAFEKIDVESYYSRLDSMLRSGKGDIDIFVVDQDHLPKYISSGYVLPIDQIGDVDTSEMYYSTIQDCTYENEIRALPLSLNPGVFLYNRTVARNALGTDDPGEVQRMISDWESFKDTARTIQSKGYKMTPNFTDMFRAFSGEAKRLTDEDGEAFVNQNALEWADTARTMYQSGLCDNNDMDLRLGAGIHEPQVSRHVRLQLAGGIHPAGHGQQRRLGGMPRTERVFLGQQLRPYQLALRQHDGLLPGDTAAVY